MSTRSDPDCSGMCRLGITLGVSAIAAMTSSVKAAGCGLVKRTRSRPVDLAAGAQQLAEREPVAELDAVGVDVLAEQGHLDDALGDERLDLGEDLAGAAVLLLAAQARDDAERAGVVAAHRDRHPAGEGGVAPGRQGRREGLERLEDLDLGALVVPGPVEQGREAADVVGAEDDVDPGGALDDGLAVLLRHAAADGDLQVGVRGLGRAQLAEVAVELVVGVLAHGAGVEDDDVGDVRALRGGDAREVDVAGGLEQPGEALGVVHVHLAPVGAHVVGLRFTHGGTRVCRAASRRAIVRTAARRALPSVAALGCRRGRPGRVVSLRPVDAGNWRDVARLTVAPGQERFVADPDLLPRTVRLRGRLAPLAVYAGGEVVGFLMWGVDDADGRCWLGGVFVAAAQGRAWDAPRWCGPSAAARGSGCRRVRLSYSPENTVARALYASLGFAETGEVDDDEVVARRPPP